MKARILDEQVKVYSSTDENAVSIATLTKGNEIDFGPAKKKAGKVWVPISLSTGQQAFIPGEARIYVLRQGTIKENSVDLLAEPADGALVKKQLTRNTNIEILLVVDKQGKKWVQVRDASGSEGYISGNTRIRVTQQKSKAMGRKNMLSGGMWLLAGVIIISSNNSGTSTSSFTLLGYGAIAFGAVMFIMGLVQFLTSPT
jgi:hypothetical protein